MKYYFCVCLVIFKFFSSILCASEEERFYVFGVGQGNAQLALYQGFGVLYDCGSSSQQIHPKLRSLQSEEYTRFIFRKAVSTEEKVQAFTVDSDSKVAEKGEEALSVVEGVKEAFDEKSESRRNSGDSNTYSNIDSTEKDIRGVIRKAIEEHYLKHLFVFISHPDADHYNKLILSSDTASGEEVLPHDIPVTVILCGDWLGNVKRETEESEENARLDQRLNFIRRLSNRVNTWIELPYYWDYEGEGTDNYESLRYSFKGMPEVPRGRYERFCPRYYPYNPTEPFQGNLKSLLLSIRKRYVKEGEAVTGSAPSDLENQFRHHFEGILSDMRREESEYENIHIWLMNQRFDDINSQSSIVSFIMQDLKMHFICTGDAHDETFYHSLLNVPQVSALVNSLNEDRLANILVVPHHGSSGNLSRRMLDIFKPDLCVISAGNGKQHGHPNKEMIDSYTYAIEIGLIRSKFAELFDIEQQGLFAISYSGRGDTEIGFLSKFSKKYPLISTNVHGTIKFENDGVYSSFSDIIEIVEGGIGQSYIVNFKKKDREIQGILDELRELQQLQDDELSHKQAHMVAESIEAESGSKRKDVPLDENSMCSLHTKIRNLEERVNAYDLENAPLNLDGSTNSERLKQLGELFCEQVAGENIILINNKYYYKVVRLEGKISKTKKKGRVETQYNYYPVKRIPPQDKES